MLFLHWAANTLSKLQHSCVLLYPFNLIAASFCLWLLCDFFLLSVWQKTAQPLRSSFLLQGAIDRLFLALRGRCTLLDFKFKFQEFNDKNKFSSSSFSDVGDWSKITCKWTNQIFSFFSYFFGTWKQDKRFISSKKFMNNHKGKSKYLFIYLLFFLGMPFCFFL